ncbi:Hsp20 family protein [Patescibacteria group bacterium]|jgi:HSP20 family protein|nr:Hsp20 family protein [Patescibacteria group bacterium]
MSLIKWEPFDEFDRFFRDASAFPMLRGSGQGGFDLAVDVYEDGDNLVAEMNLPGIDPEKVDVEVEDNYLRIAGRREEVNEKKEKSHYAKEIRRGSFERAIALPDLVDQEGTTAEYDGGVLKVVMPKKAHEPKGKVKIDVKK